MHCTRTCCLAGPGRTNLGAYVASAASNFTDWALIGLLGTPGEHQDAGYSSLLRCDGGPGKAENTEYLVLVETCGSHTTDGNYGLWLVRFKL